MARGAVENTFALGAGRIVVRAHRIAGAEAGVLERRFQDQAKPLGDLDQASSNPCLPAEAV